MRELRKINRLWMNFVAALLSSCSAAVPAPIPVDVPARRTLTEFTDQLMTTCGVKLSEARRISVRNQAVRITEQYLETRAQQESFLLLVCIESRFQNTAVSKAGAIGLTQIMPQYAQQFADTCKLGKLELPRDLQDGELNLKIGACHFGQLLLQFEGNVALALSGYNSGAGSKTTKQLGMVSEIGAQTETLGYLSKYLVLQEKMRHD